jgi:hypothetical protein
VHCVEVRDTSENGMAVVAAVKAGEMLKEGALQAEAAAQRGVPGLQIVLLPAIGSSGEPKIAFELPPMLDVTPAREAEVVPVPADGEAE